MSAASLEWDRERGRKEVSVNAQLVILKPSNGCGQRSSGTTIVAVRDINNRDNEILRHRRSYKLPFWPYCPQFPNNCRHWMRFCSAAQNTVGPNRFTVPNTNSVSCWARPHRQRRQCVPEKDNKLSTRPPLCSPTMAHPCELAGLHD